MSFESVYMKLFTERLNRRMNHQTVILRKERRLSKLNNILIKI